MVIDVVPCLVLSLLLWKTGLIPVKARSFFPNNDGEKKVHGSKFSKVGVSIMALVFLQCRVDWGSVWMPMSEGGCWPLPAPSTGRGLRRGGTELAGRMSGGGGWFSAGRGWMKRACCCSGGGWRCRAGAAGSAGRSNGGGWFRAATGAAGAGAEACAGGEGPKHWVAGVLCACAKDKDKTVWTAGPVETSRGWAATGHYTGNSILKKSNQRTEKLLKRNHQPKHYGQQN